MSAPDTEPNNKADHPGVIAPPPLIFIVGLAIGVGLNALLGGMSTHLPTELLFLTASALLIAGFTLIVRSTNRFHLAKTNARPWKPTTAIVTEGIYKRTRNPMYLAMACIYAALALALDNLAALIVLLPVLFVVDRYVIQREERYLEAKFAAEYLAYKTKVRRWL
jgi:protein-S-isoprenylcysteine O-methyltransferase Ste14